MYFRQNTDWRGPKTVNYLECSEFPHRDNDTNDASMMVPVLVSTAVSLGQ